MLLRLTCMAALLVPAIALPCEPLPCLPGYVQPRSGSIPQNAPGILYAPARTFPDGEPAKRHEGKLSLTDAKGREVKTTSRNGVFRPSSGWRLGERYALTAVQKCPFGEERGALKAELTVTRRAKTPTALGKLEVSPQQLGPLRVSTSGGSCSIESPSAWVDVEVALDASAKPWAELFVYETRVDGKRWLPTESLGIAPLPGWSWVGRGKDRLYVTCGKAEGDPGLSPGVHRVQMRARIPGLKGEWSTPEVRVNLFCPKL